MTKLPPPGAPMAVVRELIVDHTVQECITLRRWRGDWLRWQGAYWADMEDAAIRAWLYRRLEKAEYLDKEGVPQKWQPNRRKVADVLDALAALVHLPESVDPPSWLGISPAEKAREIVPCPNGLLHVPTRRLLPTNPRFFSRVAVPFDYDPEAAEPKKWLEFLRALWPADPDAIKALQEYFGYILSGRTDLQKILMLIGPTRAGKGVIARVLTKLIGSGNMVGPTLAGLGTNFGLQPLIGKPLAIISDARLGNTNVHQIVERLLSISGEDSLTLDRKYRDPWTGKLPTRFVILSNELPRFGDASAAIAHRFLVLTLKNSFLGKENPNLTEELYEELPGVLCWALDGLDRLAEKGRFTKPRSSEDAVQELVNIASPVTAFVREECEVGPEKSVTVKDLFQAWKDWCEDGDHKPGDVQLFGRDLRAVATGLRRARPREGDVRVPTFVGIGLKSGRVERRDDESKNHNGEGRGPSRPKLPTSDDADEASRPNYDETSPDASLGRAGSRSGLNVDATTPPTHDGQLTISDAAEIVELTPKTPRPVRRKCADCRKAIPKTTRADAKFCSATCRKRSNRHKTKETS